MDVDEARRILGVGADADERSIRAAHRREIRRAHPDAGGSAAEAARINDALAALRGPAAMATAPPPVTHPPRSPAGPPDDVDQFYVIDDAPTDLLARLAEAGHEIGEVVFVDPFVGLLEIVVGDPPAVGQLAVTVGERRAEGTAVSFTLEPLGVTPAPPIAGVVDALMRALRP